MKTDMITFDEKNQVFNLSNDYISYIFSVEEGKTLAHLYFGKKIRNYHGNLQYPRISRSFSANLPGSEDKTFSRDTLPKEYSSAGEGDFRTPAAVVKNENGAYASFLTYKSYQIINGKPKMQELPASFVDNTEDAQTLIIVLEDKISKLEFDLSYTIFRKYPIIVRSVKVRNMGNKTVFLNKVSSMQLDFVDKKFESITLPGAHMNERNIERNPLHHGLAVYSSNRGVSSPQMNPFIALVDKNTNEFSGEVYGFSLVYSGNHKIELEEDQINQVRLNMGINDYNFSWKLAPEESFQTPEIIMVHSNDGLNGMSQSFHHFIDENIITSKFKNSERPILINNWEATYFDFTEEKLLQLVKKAKDLGIEMFVLDDGWFGHRNDSRSSLGDWTVNTKKFPKGLIHFAKIVHGQGMQFGLWFEPEMISHDSELYKKHPDYLMHVPGRVPSPSRHQYVLDLGRKEVRDEIFNQLDKILSSGQIDYVKWDMNRHLTDIFQADLPADQQGETYHRYVLGLYNLLDRITSKYDNILFESCSSGGGRFDLGMSYYMPQTWTSDNTDAVARMKIQYGTSLIYPTNMIGAHVSVSPNEQTGRLVPLDTRYLVAMSGVLGYELDLTKLSPLESKKIKRQISSYKKFRNLIQFGDFYRLKSPFDTNQAAWNFVSKDQKEALVFSFNVLSDAQPIFTETKMYGLNPDVDYKDQDSGKVFGGDELMEMGFYDEIAKHDFIGKMRYFKAI